MGNSRKEEGERQEMEKRDSRKGGYKARIGCRW